MLRRMTREEAELLADMIIERALLEPQAVDELLRYFLSVAYPTEVVQNN